MILPNYRLEGIITLQRVAPDGTITEKRTFRNMILDSGIGATVREGDPVANLCMYCMVGTGNTPPQPGDIALVAKRADQIRDNAKMTYQQQYAVPAWAQITLGYRFPAGAATGNLSEIGFAPTASPAANNPSFSRALIRDAAGNPTTITVLATEALDVTYQVRMYWPEDKDLTGTFVIDGVTYSYVGKVMRVTADNDISGAACLGSRWITDSNAGTSSRVWSSVTTPATATSNPVGTLVQNARWGGANITPYVPGVNNRTKTYATNAGSIPTGVIAACEFRWSNGAPRIVMQFTPPVPIDVTQSFTVGCMVTLGR